MKTKKLLGTALSLAMILPSFGIANAVELFKNLKLSGQIDVEGVSARNTSDFSTRGQLVATAAQGSGQAGIAATANNDRIGDTYTRTLLHLDWDLLDDVHAKLTLAKNDRTWGSAGNGGGQTNGTGQTIGAAGGTNILSTFWVDQAYFKVDKVFGAVDTTIGRQYYGNPGDLVIYFGPSDKPEYGLPTNAIDAARFDWSNDQLGITALAGKAAGHTIGVAVPNADKDLTGLIASLKGNDNWSGSLYTWNVQTHAIGPLGNDPNSGTTASGNALGNGKNDNLYVTGAKIKLAGGGAWFKGEFAKDWGDNRVGLVTQSSARYKGWALLADLGYKADVSGVGTIVPWGNFGYGTGQRDFYSNERRGFVAVSGDYRPGQIYSRFAPYTNAAAGQIALGGGATGGNVATNTLGNRVITGLGVKVTPDAVKKLTVGVEAWDFHTQTLALVNTPTMGGPVNSAFSGNKHIGYETDVTAEWKHSDNVIFDVTGGRFMPGGIIYEANQSTRLGGLTNNNGGATVDASARSGKGTNPALLAAFDVRVKF